MRRVGEANAKPARRRVRGRKKENPLVEYRPLMIAHGARAHDPDRYVNFARLGKMER